MAFGSSSAVFVAHIVSSLGTRGTSDTGFVGANTHKVALFNNSVTPDKNAAVASTGYNTGTWLTANEVTHANWLAGGRALASKTGAQVGSTSVARFGAANLAGGGTLTIANAYGCLVYNDSVTAGTTVADQGVCFNAFGGAQSVTNGTFTIVWSANGIFEIAV